MIGMPVVQSICDDYLRLILTDSLYDDALGLLIIFKKTVFESQVFTNSYSQYPGGSSSLSGPRICRTTRTQFAACQVDYPHLLTVSHIFCNRAPGSKFSIIGVHSHYQ